MDELNVQQLWGISPYINLLAAARMGSSTQHGGLESAADAAGATAVGNTTAVLQICPYDCRHTLVTVSNYSSSFLQQQQQQHQQHQQLHVYVFETEPEGLCRHVLLLSLLLDASLTARERAEMFLELHGNVMLRQGTAEWVCAASRWLEAAVVGQLPSKQQEQQNPVEAFLQTFDFSLLKYKERDSLQETFQQYRSKLSFDMPGAWQGRCRKWYADRYDFRENMVDWDYHIRLSQRGTPFLDPGMGSIIHPYHFKHWRLTGVAYELRESSYTATNTSMLVTAYGRTKEFKDRYLRDVGRSVSAYGFWGEILNPPYHAFGTVSDYPALLKQVNKQFSHTSVDVAEHNLLGFIEQLCGAKGLAAAATPAADSNGSCSSGEAHRARAARGPTSLEQLTAHAAEQAAEAQGAEQSQQQQQDEEPQSGEQQQQSREQQQQCEEQQQMQDSAHKASVAAGKQCSRTSGPLDAAGAADQAAHELQALSVQHTEQQQEKQADKTSAHSVQAAAQQAAAELERLTAAVQQLTSSVRIFLLTRDLKRSLTGKAGFAGRFAAATVGHRHVHLLGPEHGLAGVMHDSAPVLVETAANMVQLNGQQVAAFEGKLLELATAAGFRRHPAFNEQQQPAFQAKAGQCPADTDRGVGNARSEAGSRWRLPPGHLALLAQH